MEANPGNGKHGEKKSRTRFMGKLFKDKADAADEDGPQGSGQDVDEFLYGPSDELHMVGTSPSFPPPLIQINTSNARRWPSPSQLQASRSTRRHSTSTKRTRKGLVVRFSDAQPEVIGEGGDEATSPVAEIGMRRRANTDPPVFQPRLEQQSTQSGKDAKAAEYGYASNMDEFQPGPFRRTQTGFQSIPDPQPSPEPTHVSKEDAEDGHVQVLNTRNHADRRSFADMVRAEMRSGEGQALVQGRDSPDELFMGSETAGASAPTAQFEELHINTMNNQKIPTSPGFAPSVNSSRPGSSRPLTPSEERAPGHSGESPASDSRTSTLTVPKSLQPSVPITGHQMTESPATLSRTSTLSLQDAAIAVGDDALKEFSRRTAHLCTLFRLSTEATKPLSQCSLEELVRVALWWFLKGRMNLESAVRERPGTLQAQQANYFIRAQAYADLAKSLWITETVTSKYPETQLKPGSTGSDPSLGDVLDARQGILSSLRKLTMSMKRNNFLPPDPRDAPLTQGLDPSIWMKGDGDKSLTYSQRLTSVGSLSEAFPLGDTTRTFHYVRVFAEATLLEAAAPQTYRCPVLVSIVRGVKDTSGTAVISSQDGLLNLMIQADKARGLTWDDIRWRASQNLVEVKLPRGFVLHLQFTEQDFRLLWNVHEYETRTRAVLIPKSAERVVFETVLQSLQYFGQSPQHSFPKEAQPHCHMKLFEKTAVIKAATGPRTMHRGFRVALNTSTKSKNLRCLDQDLLPSRPIQFGFLRGEGGAPAILLKILDEKSSYTVVCTFKTIDERTRFHTLLTGIALNDGEDVISENTLQGLSIADSEAELACLQALEWQAFRFINYDQGDLQDHKTVLSPNLRIVIDFKGGSITDRINVEPGELKLRLDVQALNEIKVLRLPQQDMSLSVAESQVPKELPRDLTMLLESIAKSESTRKYTFPSLAALHSFQASLTGFAVAFDGVACSFNISRRRMVVPIYKKWDAATTRVQIVQKEKVVQLVAFFDNFNHGKAMNFTLKSTDNFEASSSKKTFSLRIVDAKFALPKDPRGVEAGIEHEFVCLDMPEYPGEHDDVTIVFDTEAVRDAFTKALPAPVKMASRMGSVRR
ncbi:uncharacterized protein L3040_009108 [Drepanopeziza brunnea f. sp. 'multigermtubi']|uniref:uncharacterized protein n=1 Tax=Drepanopeziza brunnea f. sp. 'multigermtubi' TaxID=698441 RepID=UPI00238A36CB|nr:hypothetical protein L3040_009108 [Drepanopeziza brunnea f. sp. 'multigermtubi']